MMHNNRFMITYRSFSLPIEVIVQTYIPRMNTGKLASLHNDSVKNTEGEDFAYNPLSAIQNRICPFVYIVLVKQSP